MPSLGMGQIFTVGSTAAMAWQLPHEPIVFDKKHKEISDEPEPMIPATEENLPMFYGVDPHSEFDEKPDAFHVEYEKPEEFHPEYDRKDYNNYKSYNNNGKENSKYFNFNGYNRINRPYARPTVENAYHTSYHRGYVEPEHWHVYRRTRRDLYGKLQKLLNALSRDGRACILKLICEVSQVAERKGSFMEEMVKVIFRIKTKDNMKNEDEYDKAFNKTHNCAERYKACPESFFFGIYN